MPGAVAMTTAIAMTTAMLKLAYCMVVLGVFPQIAIHKLYQTEDGIAVVQMSDAPLPVRPYIVTNAAAFPSLPLPVRGLVFVNGLYQTQGVDYDAVGGSFRFRAGALSDGDRIAVVTLP